MPCESEPSAHVIYLCLLDQFGPSIIYITSISFIYLTASGLSCSTRDLHCIPGDLSFWHMDSQVVVHGLRSCGMQAWLLWGLWDLCSPTRDWIHIPCTTRQILFVFFRRQILNQWITREDPLSLQFLMRCHCENPVSWFCRSDNTQFVMNTWVW